tara:strand:+ start:300 stop:401 length:102 start_codon:yes stop_codon:yes gene_type:complete
MSLSGQDGYADTRLYVKIDKKINSSKNDELVSY